MGNVKMKQYFKRPCDKCNKTFTPRVERRKNTYFQIFTDWITEGASVNYLNKISEHLGVTTRTLRTHLHGFLCNPPPPKPPNITQEIYLKADGTYWKRWGCSLVYKAGKDIISEAAIRGLSTLGCKALYERVRNIVDFRYEIFKVYCSDKIRFEISLCVDT